MKKPTHIAFFTTNKEFVLGFSFINQEDIFSIQFLCFVVAIFFVER